jgi:hypothetical protein
MLVTGVAANLDEFPPMSAARYELRCARRTKYHDHDQGVATTPQFGAVNQSRAPMLRTCRANAR